MNGCRLTKMAVQIVSESHVVTTPDYDVFPHIQSHAALGRAWLESKTRA